MKHLDNDLQRFNLIMKLLIGFTVALVLGVGVALVKYFSG